jgi:feruloyl esterase
MGKAFTTAFYGQVQGAPQKIDYSYFSGCSGGGRDAFVAASYFPEEFDGIVGGSAYNLTGRAFHGVGTALATLRSPDAGIPAPLLALVDKTVKAQCDARDGVKDGLIQNPAACNFDPRRDLPKCADDKPAAQCFTKAQLETLSTVFTAATDEHGKVVQPGFSVSELQADFAPPKPAQNPGAPEPWPDDPDGGLYALGNATLKVFAHRNDPAFSSRSIVSYQDGGAGAVTNYRVVVPAAEVAKANEALAMGVGHSPENASKLIQQNRKFLIWHNFSDEKLSPYMSINYYKQLAKLHGGYAKLQDNVRLFMIPGSGHCSMSGVGPNNFDALTAIENWVEQGKAPDALPAKLYPAKFMGSISIGADFSKPAVRSMPLCKFPEMARYRGKGDVDDGASWTCSASDTRLLQVGESGRQAGVLE